jgi:hypothetical protein
MNAAVFDPTALMVPTADERDDMIAVAAYFIAERRGFVPGGADDDWLRAERQIDAMLEGMRRRGVTRGQFERAGMRNALQLWSRDDPSR